MIGTMLVLLSLPVAVALIEAVSFYVLNASNGTLISAGRHRDYLLFVPKSYDSAKPTPLVISMHGAAMWGAAQKDTSQWNTVAEREGFMVVYPSGAKSNGPSHWEEEDVTFIPTRIYANGLSNGGGMAFALSCTLSDRLSRDSGWGRAVPRRDVVGLLETISGYSELDRELGSQKPLRAEPY